MIYDKCPICGMRLPYQVKELKGNITYAVYCRKCKKTIIFQKEGREEPLELKKQ